MVREGEIRLDAVDHSPPTSMNTEVVKRLFEVDNVDIQWRVPFDGLLDDDPERSNLVCTLSTCSESCLFFS